MHGLTRFLGDSPGRVVVRLIVMSFIVGLVLAALNVHPVEIFQWLERTVYRVYNMGFAAIEGGLRYLVLGAVIVVPLFLLSRVLKFGRGSGRN